MQSTSEWIFGDRSHKSFGRMFNHAYHHQLPVVAFILAALALVGCGVRVGAVDSDAKVAQGNRSMSLQEEKHRLYSAALAASDSPLDTPVFKEVCQKIGIFGADGSPNGEYMGFVKEHVAWSMNGQANQFRSEINTKEKAQQYLTAHLPRSEH